MPTVPNRSNAIDRPSSPTMTGALRSLGNPNRTLMGIAMRTGRARDVTVLRLAFEAAEVAPLLRYGHQVFHRLDDPADRTIPHVGRRRRVLEDQHAGIGLEQSDLSGGVDVAIDAKEIQV